MNFYCVFVRTENNSIAFLGPSNCVNTQYAALSGAMNLYLMLGNPILTDTYLGQPKRMSRYFMTLV